MNSHLMGQGRGQAVDDHPLHERGPTTYVYCISRQREHGHIVATILTTNECDPTTNCRQWSPHISTRPNHTVPTDINGQPLAYVPDCSEPGSSVADVGSELDPQRVAGRGESWRCAVATVTSDEIGRLVRTISQLGTQQRKQLSNN